MKRILFSFFALLVNIINAQDSPSLKDSIQKLDEVIIKANTILGNKFVAQNRTGASYFLSAEELGDFGYIDINRALKAVPGVNFYEEDGFGLRPNISLRGTSPERSSKITLMEDGVLIAPAPYSSPAAYYFPSVARMEAIEILKGSSQVQYGPFTTGGVINLVSTAIPDEKLAARFQNSYGSFNSSQLYTSVGQSSKNVGYVLEYLALNSDGFKKLNNSDNTGFNTSDLMGKIRFQTNPEANTPQSLEIKYHFYDELSNETYLGITEQDFNSTPFTRYAASQEDVMDAEQNQWMLTHTLNLSDRFKIVTNAYDNTFSRNWYKLSGVIVDGEKKGLDTVLSEPLEYSNHLAVLKGTTNSEDDALFVKANNRVYSAKGIQTKIDYHWYGSSGAFHDLEVGARYHYDEEDRFQWEDGYRIQNFDMLLTSEGIRGVKGNRIASASAFAAYAIYKYKFKNFTLTPGIRLESINLKREDYGKSDPNRTGGDLSVRENNIDVWIPGLGFNYTFSNKISIFGGIHKGFSPPGSSPGEQAEESVNLELGSRFSRGRLSGELIGFLNNYSNLLGSDLAATGGTGSLDQFNAGAARVSGVELLLNYNWAAESATLQFPFTLAYTLTNPIFQSSFGSAEDIWGIVSSGDRIPYIPQHQWTLTGRVEHRKYEVNFSMRYNGVFGTQAGNGFPSATEDVDSNFIVDLTSKFHLSPQLSLTTQVVNLFNTTYLTGRVPAGFRPGHPFGMYAGVQFRL